MEAAEALLVAQQTRAPQDVRRARDLAAAWGIIGLFARPMVAQRPALGQTRDVVGHSGEEEKRHHRDPP